MLTVVEQFADGLPRSGGSDPASRPAVTGESFRPLLFCQDGPGAFAGSPPRTVCRAGGPLAGTINTPSACYGRGLELVMGILTDSP